MAIDVKSKRPILGKTFGGLSGPALKPIALRLVYQTAAAVDVPLIGCGGIMTGLDAMEYIMAGATAVQVGTATFINPGATLDVLDGIERFMEEEGVSDVHQLIGVARL
jgi:dihydroorotate dehydrogenase (NAD+) catalytic subunit